jgi:hypothetical protein
MIMQGKSKEEIIAVMEENDKKTKAKIRLEKAQSDVEKTKKEQAIRLKTAEALLAAGVISEEEMSKIKKESNDLIEKAQKELDDATGAISEKEDSQEKESQSQEKVEEENKEKTSKTKEKTTPSTKKNTKKEDKKD